MVRGAAAPAEQPLILPRNWRITPGASRSNVPGKVAYGLSTTWSIRNVIEALMIAGVPNITPVPPRPFAPVDGSPLAAENYQRELDTYGDTLDNWFHVNEKTLRFHADRFEVGFATAETRQLLSNLVLPLALHQQGRYLPAPVNSDFSERMGNAVASIVVTRNDAGMLVPNYSKLGGTVAAAFIGKSLYASAFHAPELNSTHFVTRYIGYSLLGDLATNVAHEVARAALEPDMSYYNLHGRSTDDSYYPLSLGGKAVYWVRSTYSIRNFVTGGLIAGLPTITDRPTDPISGFPKTYNGFANYADAENAYGESLLEWKDSLEENLRYHGRRLAGGLAESETQMALQNLAIPVLFNMDPRYVPLGVGYSGSQRLAHAFTGLVETHTDAGNKTINLPLLAGTVGAAFMAKELYYPSFNTPNLESNGVLAKTITLNLATDAVSNIIGEFLRHRGY